MKIYRFRKLTNELDYYRLKEILETGNFWCSNFWELNDPMEGVFSILDCANVVDKINEIHGEKGQYKICSFSGEDAFKNPIMWGYYAAGFKGVAIAVEVEENNIKKVNYNDSEILLNNSNGLEIDVEEILLHKNTAWNHEDEYRFLEKLNGNFQKIGTITAIYFGNPYGSLVNSVQIQENKKLVKYNKFKEKIKKVAKEKNILRYNVRSKNTVEIVKDNELLII